MFPLLTKSLTKIQVVRKKKYLLKYKKQTKNKTTKI